MNIKELTEYGSQKLKNSGIKTHNLDSLVLTSFAYRKSKEWVYANYSKKVPNRKRISFNKLIKRRGNNEPMAYIIQAKEFFGLNFFVNKNVLIPRPETETLIEKAVCEIKKRKGEIKIADIGTGSGCIAISLAKKLLKTNKKKFKYKIIASDISEKALQVARKNAKKHKVASKIIFVKTSLLKKIKNQFEIIISNPPYLKKWSRISREVLLEPKIALFEKKDMLKNLLLEINTKLKNNGKAFLEISPYQKKKIRKVVSTQCLELELFFEKDLYGKTRFAIFKKNNNPI